MKKIIYTMLALAMGCTTSMAKKITTINDLVGQYINKTTSMKEDPKFEGSSVTIHAGEKDTIIIYNLFDYGTELKAKVNMADFSLTIPSQLFYTDKTYGESDFTNIILTTSSLSPDRKTPVTGTIDPETGIITLNPWAVYINSAHTWTTISTWWRRLSSNLPTDSCTTPISWALTANRSMRMMSQT